MDLKFFETFNFSKNLIISGSVGVGKTYEAQKLLKRFIGPENCLKYEITDARFKKFITSGKMNHRRPDEWQCSIQEYPLEIMLRADILLYDDLGVSDISDAYIRDLTYILDERIERKRKTIFTTNLTEKELKEKLNERIVSRLLFNTIVVVLRGEDRRRETTEIVVL